MEEPFKDPSQLGGWYFFIGYCLLSYIVMLQSHVMLPVNVTELWKISLIAGKKSVEILINSK